MSTRKVSNLTKKKVAACQEWKCKLCNCLLDECFEIDHIICIKDGGSNEECNLQALCPNCHRKKTNSDIYKQKKETKETKEIKEIKEIKEKVHLPQWWKEYLEHPERQGRFVCDMVRSSYPQLVWNKDITNLNKYTVDELKIMLASINGQVKNGTKKEIVSFINDESIKRNNLMEQFINPVVTVLPPTNIIHSKQTTAGKISKLITSTVNTTMTNPIMMDPMMMNPMMRAMYN